MKIFDLFCLHHLEHLPKLWALPSSYDDALKKTTTEYIWIMFDRIWSLSFRVLFKTHEIIFKILLVKWFYSKKCKAESADQSKWSKLCKLLKLLIKCFEVVSQLVPWLCRSALASPWRRCCCGRPCLRWWLQSGGRCAWRRGWSPPSDWTHPRTSLSTEGTNTPRGVDFTETLFFFP